MVSDSRIWQIQPSREVQRLAGGCERSDSTNARMNLVDLAGGIFFGKTSGGVGRNDIFGCEFPAWHIHTYVYIYMIYIFDIYIWYIYIYIFICMCIYIYVYTYIHMYVCIYIECIYSAIVSPGRWIDRYVSFEGKKWWVQLGMDEHWKTRRFQKEELHLSCKQEECGYLGL